MYHNIPIILYKSNCVAFVQTQYLIVIKCNVLGSLTSQNIREILYLFCTGV